MRCIGKIISLFAKFFLKKEWIKLENELNKIYLNYKASIKPQITEVIILTLVLAEDHRFYRHGGFDLIAIGRVLWCFLNGRTLSGGSTIEQQLVRTITGQYERQLKRKIREILLASLVHKVIPKTDIPGVYLSIAYFGWKMVGIQQATRRLKINIENISLWQAASIVSRLKYPEPKNSPHKRNRQIKMRTEYLVELSLQNLKKWNRQGTEVETNATF